MFFIQPCPERNREGSAKATGGPVPDASALPSSLLPPSLTHGMPCIILCASDEFKKQDG